MKKILMAVAAGLAMLAFNAAAHGPEKAMHGGVVQTAADLQFELVPQPGGAALYVVDHGKPADARRMTGKLTVLNGAVKSEAELKPAGANKLEAADIQVGRGSKVVALVNGAGSKPLTVRFTVK